MLDLICVSSVLIVCSSLHFTWEEGRWGGGEKRHLVPGRAPEAPASPLCLAPATLLSRLNTNEKPHARNVLLTSLGSTCGDAHTLLHGTSELFQAGRMEGVVVRGV